MPNSAVYLDYAATTPLSPELEKQIPKWLKTFGNPSSMHQFGQSAREVVEQARASVAKSLNTDAESIIFTSSGSEANALAIQGCLTTLAAVLSNKPNDDESNRIASQNVTKKTPAASVKNARPVPRLIIGATEHASIKNIAKHMQQRGYELIILPVSNNGMIDLEHLSNLLSNSNQPTLVSVQYVNSETGIIQPIKAIADLCASNQALCHVDAVQAYGKLPINFSTLPIDFLSISAHKCHALKGVGALAVKNKKHLKSLYNNSSQEFGLRMGTQHVLGIQSFGYIANKITSQATPSHWEPVKTLDSTVSNELSRSKLPLEIVGAGSQRVPGIMTICCPLKTSEDWVMAFDIHDIAVSAGSACSTGSVDISPTLLAMGLAEDMARSAFRVSFGKYTTLSDINTFIETFHKIADS